MSYWLWLFGGIALLSLLGYIVNDGLGIAVPSARYAILVFLGTILVFSYMFWKKILYPGFLTSIYVSGEPAETEGKETKCQDAVDNPIQVCEMQIDQRPEELVVGIVTNFGKHAVVDLIERTAIDVADENQRQHVGQSECQSEQHQYSKNTPEDIPIVCQCNGMGG
jgi:hypothetical protein